MGEKRSATLKMLTRKNTAGKWRCLSLLQHDDGYKHKKGLFLTEIEN